MKRFCPKCGRTDKILFHGFCVDCYVKDHKEILSIPERIEVISCPQCLRILLQKNWASGRKENIIQFIKSKLSTKLEDFTISLEQMDSSFYLTVNGYLGGEDVTLEKEVFIDYKKRLCDICRKKGQFYYEAVIQLRSKKHSNLNSAFNTLRNEARALALRAREAEIFRFERGKGIDVYFGSMRICKKCLKVLQNKMKADIRETYTMTGINKKTGKHRFHITYSVRI